MRRTDRPVVLAAAAALLVAGAVPGSAAATTNVAADGADSSAGLAVPQLTLWELADRAARAAREAAALRDLRDRQLATSATRKSRAQAHLRDAGLGRAEAAATRLVAARAESLAVDEERRTRAAHLWALFNRNAQAAAVVTLGRQAQLPSTDRNTAAALLLRAQYRLGLLRLWGTRAIATRGPYLRATDLVTGADVRLAGAELALARATQREKGALASAQVAHREYLGAIRNRDAAAAKAAAALAVYRRAVQAAQAAPRVGSGAVFEAVSEAWSSMTWTLYDHHNRVDAQAGRYQFDCVGMTNYFLKTAAPEANAELRKVESIPVGRVPKPDKVVDFIRRIPARGTTRWQPIIATNGIRAGDLLAFGSRGRDVGHAAIAAGPPARLPDGSYTLVIYDSTGLTHGPSDSRLTDIRAQPGTTHPRTGLGRGTVRLTGAGPNTWQVFWDLTRTRPYGSAVAVARPLR